MSIRMTLKGRGDDDGELLSHEGNGKRGSAERVMTQQMGDNIAHFPLSTTSMFANVSEPPSCCQDINRSGSSIRD